MDDHAQSLGGQPRQPLEEWRELVVYAGALRAQAGQRPLVAPRAFPGLAYGGRDFRKLNWVGFVSNATVSTAFYLDNVTMEVK